MPIQRAEAQAPTPKGPEGVVLASKEAELLTKLTSGEGLNFSAAAQNTVAGPFLQAAISQLKDTEAVKKNGLEVIDAEFSYFANYRLPRSSPSAPDGSGRVRHTS
jgi:hypothetical protein